MARRQVAPVSPKPEGSPQTCALSPLRIAIFGQYKTGTTAVFFCLKREMPAGTIDLFEKDRLTREATAGGASVLAKVILNSEAEAAQGFYPDFEVFDKRIYIVRDLRDWVVSGTLFSITQNRAILDNPQAVRAYMDLIRRKEDDPKSVAILDILEYLQVSRGQSLEGLLHWLGGQMSWLEAFETDGPDCFCLRYEDFVDNRLDALSDYVGLPLRPDPKVDTVFSHVARTRSYGNWRHWFTPRDVDCFRPLLAPYLNRHGYDAAWDLAARPRIDPAHCSHYVERLLRRNRRE